MRGVGLFVPLLALLSMGAWADLQAGELDEITLDVIDARTSRVEDVMRNIEIPRHDIKAVREFESAQPASMQQPRDAEDEHR